MGNCGGGAYSRREGVDADSVLAPFLGDGAAHLVDGGFGGVVGGACEALLLLDSWTEDKERIVTYAVGNVAGHRCDHNNASRGVLLFQDVREVLRGDKCANDTTTLAFASDDSWKINTHLTSIIFRNPSIGYSKAGTIC